MKEKYCKSAARLKKTRVNIHIVNIITLAVLQGSWVNSQFGWASNNGGMRVSDRGHAEIRLLNELN